MPLFDVYAKAGFLMIWLIYIFEPLLKSIVSIQYKRNDLKRLLNQIENERCH